MLRNDTPTPRSHDEKKVEQKVITCNRGEMRRAVDKVVKENKLPQSSLDPVDYGPFAIPMKRKEGSEAITEWGTVVTFTKNGFGIPHITSPYNVKDPSLYKKILLHYWTKLQLDETYLKQLQKLFDEKKPTLAGLEITLPLYFEICKGISPEVHKRLLDEARRDTLRFPSMRLPPLFFHIFIEMIHLALLATEFSYAQQLFFLDPMKKDSYLTSAKDHFAQAGNKTCVRIFDHSSSGCFIKKGDEIQGYGFYGDIYAILCLMSFLQGTITFLKLRYIPKKLDNFNKTLLFIIEPMIRSTFFMFFMLFIKVVNNACPEPQPTKNCIMADLSLNHSNLFYVLLNASIGLGITALTTLLFHSLHQLARQNEDSLTYQTFRLFVPKKPTTEEESITLLNYHEREAALEDSTKLTIIITEHDEAIEPERTSTKQKKRR